MAKRPTLLTPDENIVYKAKIHRFSYVIPGLLLGIGLLITFPPEFPTNPGSRLYAAGQAIGYVGDVIKGFIPERVWPYLVTFQALRKNYVGLLLIILGGIRLLQAFAHRNFSRYWVTNKRVVFQTSIFHKHVQEIALERLANVRIHYGLIGHLLNRGKVVVNDTGMREIEIKHLSKPEKYRQAILTAPQ